MQMPASVTALKIAMVHWCARLTDLETPSYGKGGEEDPDEIRFALVRSMSNSVGRPAQYALRACRRARQCAGDPPDCWRGEREPCEEEFALSRAIMHRLRVLWHANQRETPPGSGREVEGMSPRLLRKPAQERNNQSPAAAVTPSFQQEIAMAKGQMRSNKEKKKPKADKNKKTKSALAPSSSPFANAQSQGKPGANPYGKKGP